MLATRDGSLLAVMLAVGLGAVCGAILRWALSYGFNRAWAVMPAGVWLADEEFAKFVKMEVPSRIDERRMP